MKRTLIIILAVILCTTAFGCNTADGEYASPVTFFYCSDKADYAADSSVLQSEDRIVNCAPGDYRSILQIYLEGPKEHGLYAPFPEGLTVTELIIDGETTYITFSTELSYLTGVDLTLACVCIANTCFSLTHTQNVDISAEFATLDNAPSVLISRGSTITTDLH